MNYLSHFGTQLDIPFLGIVFPILIQQVISFETFQLNWVSIVAVPIEPFCPTLTTPSPILKPLLNHIRMANRRNY